MPAVRPGADIGPAPQVPETRFGKWFLRSRTWEVHVLERALRDLERLIPQRRDSYEVVVDVGCGCGPSLPRLQARFRPQVLVGVDIDAESLQAAQPLARRVGAHLVQTSSSRLPLADASCDLLFCHQTFHHLVEQELALAEFFRVLKPGGLLLFAESMRRYIDSWIIRLLFRHPMDVQRTAPEYLRMLRGTGFVVPESSISYPFLWWSREDLGIAERWFGIAPPAQREETLMNLVAVKPEC